MNIVQLWHPDYAELRAHAEAEEARENVAAAGAVLPEAEAMHQVAMRQWGEVFHDAREHDEESNPLETFYEIPVDSSEPH